MSDRAMKPANRPAAAIGKDAARPEAVPPEAVANARLPLRIARRLVRYYLRGYHRFDLLTPVYLPPAGNGILVCNHISGLDPVILQDCTPRLLIWMMAREYYEVPFLKSLYRSIEAIPVERSGRDLASTRRALRMLEAGYVIGLFPEGRIAPAGDVLPFQTGVALLAMRSGAPVYPAYITGTMYDLEMADTYLYPQSFKVAFGPAVEFDRTDGDKAALEAATDKIHAAVVALRDRYMARPPARPQPAAGQVPS